MRKLAITSLIVAALGAALGHASSVQGYSSAVVDTVFKAKNTNTGGSQKAITGTATGSSGIGVEGVGTSYGVHGEGDIKGVYGRHTGGGGGYGVDGYSSGSIGVRGESNTGTGVYGLTISGDGVVGFSGGGTGTYGVRGNSEGAGVWGGSNDGDGVKGTSTNGSGVLATSSNGYGVYVTSDYNDGVNASGYYTGVNARVTGSWGTGVNGIGSDYGSTGVGVMGQGNSGLVGYGNGIYEGNAGFGVSGTVYNGDVAYGVYGNAMYAGQNWSGYFEGDVYVGGYFDNPSDIMFKKNVRKYEGGLNKIMSLEAKSYDMKTEEFKDKVYLPSGPQVGFIAQELEKVMPELVHPVTAPGRLTPEERKKGVKAKTTNFKSVDYLSLIPVLVQAIQEQQKEIEALKAGR